MTDDNSPEIMLHNLLRAARTELFALDDKNDEADEKLDANSFFMRVTREQVLRLFGSSMRVIYRIPSTVLFRFLSRSFKSVELFAKINRQDVAEFMDIFISKMMNDGMSALAISRCFKTAQELDPRLVSDIIKFAERPYPKIAEVLRCLPNRTP